MAGNTTPGFLLRDSRLASKIFGLGQGSLTTVPKPKFLFFVKFYQKSAFSALSGTVQTPSGISITNTCNITTSLEEMGFVAKMVDKPKVRFQTEVLNQYNKKRLIQTKHEFQPITMKFHDTVDNRIFQMFQAYYKFYYGDAWNTSVMNWQNDVVAPNFVYGSGLGANTPWGYNPPTDSLITSTNSYFFDRIEIYQIFNGMYDLFTLVNPKIESFDPDEMNYEDGKGISEITMTIQYEGMILNVTNQSITPKLDAFGLNLSDELDVPASFVPAPNITPVSTTASSSTLTQPATTTTAPISTTTGTTVSTSNFAGQFDGTNNTGTVATAYNNNVNNPNIRNVDALTATS
jgi:hypothetical protein